MNDEPGERQERAARDADETGYSTATTAAGGERPAGGDAGPRDDGGSAMNQGEDVAAVGPGGTPPGIVSPLPGTSWPNPLGDDEERDLERRTE